MNVDLHVHCSERSGCCISTLKEQIHGAKRAGLDAIALTDHMALLRFDEAAQLSQKHDFRIFAGIEINCVRYDEHFIVLGVDDRELEQRDWQYEDLYDFVRERGGFIILCHPYRYNPTEPPVVHTRVPDAIEVHSTNITAAESARALALARQIGAHIVTNSDAHYSGSVGMYYNRLETAAADDTALVAQLRSGAFAVCEI